MDVFPDDGLQHDGVDVLPCGGGRFHLVEQVETVMLVQMMPVGSVGADGRKALEVAAVSLTAKGMEPLKTPW